MTNAQSLFERAHALMQASDGGEKLRAAAEAMKLAADAGHPGAANNYGALLQHGRGVDEDLTASRSYYKRAADTGLAAGLFNYGFMVLHGLGGEKDLFEARDWFEKAAQCDPPDTDALTHLGRMAMVGEGGPQDFTAARSYWAKGAEAGDDRCAFNLGVACAGGHGAAPNFVEAVQWFGLARGLGSAHATGEIRKLLSVMSPNERTHVDAQILVERT